MCIRDRTCSTHFDNAERGFSFNKDGPLDMRFDNSKGLTVSDWINKAGKKEIMDVLYTFGDEKHGKLISEAIISHREKYLIDTTSKLTKIIEEIYPDKKTKIQDNTFESLKVISNDGKRLVLSYEKSKLSIDSIISEIKKQDIKIQDISTDDGDLEDVFLRLTKN